MSEKTVDTSAIREAFREMRTFRPAMRRALEQAGAVLRAASIRMHNERLKRLARRIAKRQPMIGEGI